MLILALLAEIHPMTGLKLNIKFEVFFITLKSRVE